MTASLSTGLRNALRGVDLIVLLWLVSVLFGAVFGLASAFWLSDAFEGSLANHTLYKNLDPNLLIDLYVHHREGLRMLLLLVALMAPLYVLVWCILYGAVIALGSCEPRPSLRECLAFGVAHAPRLAGLALIATTVIVSWTALVGCTAWQGLGATAAAASDLPQLTIVGTAVVVWIGGAVLAVTIHDHARIRACRDDLPRHNVYAWAARFVLRGRKKAISLALILTATAVVVWGVYQGIEFYIVPDGALGMTGLILWGELYLFARTFVRVWSLGAQAALQKS